MIAILSATYSNVVVELRAGISNGFQRRIQSLTLTWKSMMVWTTPVI